MLVASVMLWVCFMEFLITFTSKILFPHPHVPVEITYIDVTDKECVILNSSESFICSHFL